MFSLRFIEKSWGKEKDLHANIILPCRIVGGSEAFSFDLRQ